MKTVAQRLEALVWRWCDWRGRIPWLVRRFRPGWHFCVEMDGLSDPYGDCCCGLYDRSDLDDEREPEGGWESLF